MSLSHSVVKKVACIFAIVVVTGVTVSCNSKDDSSTQSVESAQVTASASSELPMASSMSPKISTNGANAGSMETMIERLQIKLKNNPADINGWILLCKSYQFLQRWPEAEAAFSQAKKLGYKGEMPSTGAVGGSAASVETREDQAMINHIGKLAADTDENSNGVSVNISISAALRNTLDPQSVVYIFARAVPTNNAQPSGPPLAVVKKKVADLPTTLTLDDSMAMMPQLSLSSAEQVVIVARISKSGNPLKQADDIEKFVGPVDSNSSDAIDIVISADGI